MINTVFLNVNLSNTHQTQKIRLSGTAPSKRTYKHEKSYLEYWMNQSISDEEYTFLQKYLNIDNLNINPIEYFNYTNEYHVERRYRHKSSLDTYFFYLKNRSYQRAFSAYYKKKDDKLIRVDRKNCFAHIAKTIQFPHPQQLQLVSIENPLFLTLLHNDISGLIYAHIKPKKEYCTFLQKYHPFKIHIQEHYQTFSWKGESLCALLSKEEWRIYQQYMDIEPLWMIGATNGVNHPLFDTLEEWQNIREQSHGILQTFAKAVILNTVSYGSKHYKKRQYIDNLNELDIPNQFATETLPSMHSSFFNLYANEDYIQCKYIDLQHPGSFFMWNHLIQAAATADMFQHMVNIYKLNGIVHYANVDSLHYSLPDGESYTFPSHWKVEDENIDEAIWFTAGRWATQKEGYYHFTGFPKTENETLILEMVDGKKMMWNAFNLPAQRHWRVRRHYIEWETLNIKILLSFDEDKKHEFRRRFMSKFKQQFDIFKNKNP